MVVNNYMRFADYVETINFFQYLVFLKPEIDARLRKLL